MSGHSRWQQIKHKKGISDRKKGQIFSKLVKKITIASRDGADPNSNYRLHSAIEEARALNMPKENIERAVKKAGEKGPEALSQVIIQAIGPGSTAIVVEAITDNKNRTINELKNILAKNEARMVNEGSLNWMFDKNWRPHAPIELTDQTIILKLDRLFDELDNHDDVENIYSNLS